jgi:peptidoglycan/LPS O-acetylase OafA/YrhL
LRGRGSVAGFIFRAKIDVGSIALFNQPKFMTKLPATPLPAGAERFHEIDLLRAVACLMVVVFHYGYRGAQDGWSPVAEPSGLGDVARYGYLGVHLFFIISGFVIFLSVRNATIRDFFASRVSRLYPAFWVAVPVTWGVVFLFDLPDLRVSWQHMMVNLTMVPHWFGVPYVDGAYWSLAVELQFYLLVGIALRFDLDRWAEWWLAGWLLLALVNGIRPMYPMEFWLAANWAPLFVIGALAYRIRSHGVNRWRVGLMVGAYSLAVWYGVQPVLQPKHGQESTQNPWVVGILLSLFVFIFIAIAIGRFKMKRHAIFHWAGILTYPVYLLHEYIGYAFLSWLEKKSVGLFVSFILVFGGVVLMAWILNKWVEKPLAPRLRGALRMKPLRRVPVA